MIYKNKIWALDCLLVSAIIPKKQKAEGLKKIKINLPQNYSQRKNCSSKKTPEVTLEINYEYYYYLEDWADVEWFEVFSALTNLLRSKVAFGL